MKNAAFFKTLGSWAGAVVGAAFSALIWAEKQVFFRTGIRGRALAWLWHEQGQRLQKRLNSQHGTAIQYGYISSK